ncbi:mechanosensitive ion channel family protein [Nocardioides seonyuensis]|uniref:Mechanosensitive ion channel family protein n=1 Tax=Nocardioides seonyuensis TaxID=2518371 RepID=A0A4P7IF72_9ACTN|nr:mechanosensitive ion channel family protein [Nocardioides seonyuensis]QBX54331.1 mechanosensitive ion channel family protein [Nocardioides seonyuensis]
MPSLASTPLADLSLSTPCGEDELFCRWAYDLTDDRSTARLVDWLVGTPLVLIGLLLLGLVGRWLLHRLIDRLVRRAEVGVLPDRLGRVVLGGKVGERISRTETAGATRRIQRAQTMGSLLKSIISGVVFAVVVTMMLSEVGADIGPILASAGILGVALGFGAQSLVKDFLSGIFMIFEDQYGVGDVVDLGEASGTVEAVSLRVTRLRDVNGTVWYVRNGEIIRVGNMSQNWARTVLDVTVDYGEDLVHVRRVLEEVAHSVWEDPEFEGLVIEEPEVWGVESLAYEGVVVRVTLKTAPMEQWAVARALRERIKARFDHEEISIPHPTRIVTTPAAAVAEQTGEEA